MHFLLKNSPGDGPVHVFSDIRRIAAEEGGCRCFKHAGQFCELPSERPDCFVAGFVCKRNSTQNPKRFHHDAVQPEGNDENMDTFFSCVRLIKKTQPKVAVLENVAGLECQRGGGVQSTVLDFVLGDPIFGLKNLPGYSCATVHVSAMDVTLPTRRDRIWFSAVPAPARPSTHPPGLRSARRIDGSGGHVTARFILVLLPGDAKRVAEMIEQLLKVFKKEPTHSVESFMRPSPNWPAHPWVGTVKYPTEPVALERRRAAYSEQFAKSLHQTLESGIDLAAVPAPPHRLSARIDPDIAIPASFRAILDVLALYSAAHPELQKPVLADISQSATRLKVKSAGYVHTLTTSSKIVRLDVDDDAGCKNAFLSPRVLMSLHGFPSNMNTSSLTWNEDAS